MEPPMPIKKKRCRFCRRWFTPNPRAPHQICCGSSQCRELRKSAADRSWRQNNSGYDKSRAGKKRVWASGKGYWRTYRRNHPDYVIRDNRRRRRAHKSGKNAANQDAVHKIAVEKLASIRAMPPVFAANQDAVARRVDLIVDYLILKEPAANPNGTDNRGVCGP